MIDDVKDTSRVAKFDLANFKKVQDAMINDNGYLDVYRSERRKKTYTLSEIEDIIANGDNVQKADLSRTFFQKSGFYKRLITYYATLLKYSGVLIPNPAPGKDLSQDFIQKRYDMAINFVDVMSLPIFLANCSFKAFVDGCYYGIIQKLDKKTFTYIDLPYAFCRSRFKNQSGSDVIEFDLSFFDTIYDEKKKKIVLSAYPLEIRRAYTKYKKMRRNVRTWYIIPSDLGICFKLLDGLPFFLNVIPATLEYEDAVETERERDNDEIRKIIVQKIPHLQSDGTLLFEPDEAEVIHHGAVGMLKGNKNISVLTTYAEVDAIQSKTSADANNNSLEKMLSNIYSEAGTSAQIFAATGNLSVGISMKNDLALIMILGNKYSKFITDVLNKTFANTNVNFTYYILPISYYNDVEYMNDTYKLATTGYSFLLPAIAIGLNQRDLVNIKNLENLSLDLHEKLIPLSSAYTQSANGPGAPEKSDDDKSPKTIQNQESIDKQGQIKEKETTVKKTSSSETKKTGGSSE